MSNLVKNVALAALLTNNVQATKLVQKSVMSLEDSQPGAPALSAPAKRAVESKGLIAQNFATAEAMALDDAPTYPDTAMIKLQKGKPTPGQLSWAQATADEYEQEENDAGTPHELPRLSVEDISELSGGLLKPAAAQATTPGTGQQAPATISSEKNVAPAKEQVKQEAKAQLENVKQQSAPTEMMNVKPVEQQTPSVEAQPKEQAAQQQQETSSQSAPSEQQNKELPQSGSPASDAVIGGLKATSGRKPSEAQVQLDQSNQADHQVAQANGDLDYLKFAENKAEAYGTVLNSQTLKAGQVKKEDAKKEEPKKEEVAVKKEEQPVQVQPQESTAQQPYRIVDLEKMDQQQRKSQPSTTNGQEQAEAKQEQNKDQNATAAAKRAETEQNKKYKEEIKKLAKEQEAEDDAAISKVVASIKTDDEKMETVMKDIQHDRSQEMGEAKKELRQLHAGEFDSLLSSGQAAVPEAKEKQQPSGVPKPAAPTPALTKVAQSLGDNIKPKSLDLDDLKSAQVQIQQMISSMEKAQGPGAKNQK